MSLGNCKLKQNEIPYQRRYQNGQNPETMTTPNTGKGEKWCGCFGRQSLVWQFSTKLNIFLAYDPAVTLLGIYPKELKTRVQANTYTQMFTAASFMIAKTWRQTTHPFTGEQLANLYIRTMKYQSLIKRNKLSSHKKTWRKLKGVFLSERGQSEKTAYCMIPTI